MNYDPNRLTGVIYDNHPETGEPGQWRLIANMGWVNLDPNAPKDVYWNERGQNYMGELGQYYKVNPNTGEVSIDEDGRGRWYYSGMMGWVNTKPAEVQPDPGAISFGNFGGGLAGPTGEGQATANNTATSTNTGGGTGNTSTGGGATSQNNPIGWYWTGSAWLPFYQGEAPPSGLPEGWVAAVSTKPTNPPQGAGTDSNESDPNNGADPSNNGGETPGSTTGAESPSLFTPDGSMFFQGLFNASDLLYRDGGEIVSPYYNNARQNILDQLSAQAVANDRTQNTAEEIQMAQNQTPSLSATGLFNPDYAALLKSMGIG